MRLTLRVLLAYVNNVKTLLDDEQRKVVEQKLQEMPQVAELIERLRQVSRKADLPAPRVTGKNAQESDANRVAEYLDFALSPQEVDAFERLCLSSDVELGEVTDSLQILQKVLAGPPVYDKKMKDRMYQVINSTAAQATPEAEEKPAAFADVEPVTEEEAAQAAPQKLSPEAVEKSAAEHLGVENRVSVPPPSESEQVAKDSSIREKPEVPEYLREAVDKTDYVKPAAMVIGLAALLMLAVFLFGPRETPDETAETEKPEEVEQKPDSKQEGESKTKQEETKEEPVEPKPEEPAESETPEPKDSDPPKTTEPPMETPKPEEPEEPEPMPMPMDTPMPSETEKPVEPVEPMPMEEPEPEVPRVEVGDYISNDDVLLHYRPVRGTDQKVWKRLPPRAILYSGDRLNTLIASRSTISLMDSINVEVLGGTTIELLPPSEENTYGIRLITGRLVFKALKPNASFRLAMVGTEWKIELLEPETIFAIQAQPLRPEGQDPMKKPEAVEGNFYLATGAATMDSGEKLLELRASPAVGTLMPLQQTGADKPPLWVENSDISPIERLASNTFKSDISIDAPDAVVALQELYDKEQRGRKRDEVMLLAMRSLANLGEFTTLVEALNEGELRTIFLDDLVVELREAMALGPKFAEAAHDTFVKVDGPTAGEELYRILKGYTNAELALGADKTLVGYLNHDSLAHRLVAFWTLREKLSSGLTFRYNPMDDAAERQQPVEKWMQYAEEGKVRYPE